VLPGQDGGKGGQLHCCVLTVLSNRRTTSPRWRAERRDPLRSGRRRDAPGSATTGFVAVLAQGHAERPRHRPRTHAPQPRPSPPRRRPCRPAPPRSPTLARENVIRGRLVPSPCPAPRASQVPPAWSLRDSARSSRDFAAVPRPPKTPARGRAAHSPPRPTGSPVTASTSPPGRPGPVHARQGHA
jgi:hypothetical protein